MQNPGLGAMEYGRYGWGGEKKNLQSDSMLCI